VRDIALGRIYSKLMVEAKDFCFSELLFVFLLSLQFAQFQMSLKTFDFY
jgi:hypothetical protein